MTKKISTDEVQYDKDLDEIKFYWEILNKAYYSTISRLHFLKHNNPYLMSQIMYGINMATDSLLSAYTTDSKVFLCKYCKQLYVPNFPCLEKYEKDGLKSPCEPMECEYNKDMTFEEMYDYKSKKRIIK
jgi:hypothetical protein